MAERRDGSVADRVTARVHEVLAAGGVTEPTYDEALELLCDLFDAVAPHVLDHDPDLFRRLVWAVS